jgi:hypothetical protein
MPSITISSLLARLQQQPAEINRQGNRLFRLFWSTERYVVDFASDYQALGWQQFDTELDAWYFGVWVNPTTYQTLTYAEGDWTLVTCDGPAGYTREIRAAISFYGEGFVAKAIDRDGTLTVYQQDRKTFLLPEEN